MIEKFVLTSTSKDLHGIQLTKELLVNGAEVINGEEKMRYLVNHRRDYPLIGYMDNAEIIEKDGVYMLMAERVFYSQKAELNWDKELIAEIPNNPIKISRRKPIVQDLVVTLDPNNFDGTQKYLEVEKSLKINLNDEAAITTDTRKGFIPDPRIIVSLLTVGSLWECTKPFIKKVGEKIADDIGDNIYSAAKKQGKVLVANVRKIMTLTRPHIIPTDKPLSLIFELHGEPYIELHTQTDDPNLVAKGLSITQLSKMMKRVGQLCDNVKIAEAHFNLDDKGGWKFTYLLTVEGVQIGKKAIFKKRDKLMRRIKLNPRYGHSIGADVNYQFPNSKETNSQ